MLRVDGKSLNVIKLVFLKLLNIQKAIYKPFVIKVMMRASCKPSGLLKALNQCLAKLILIKEKLVLLAPGALKPGRDRCSMISSQGVVKSTLGDPKFSP